MKNQLNHVATADWMRSRSRWARRKLLWAWLAPMLATGVFVWQAWLLATVVQAIVVDTLPWETQIPALTWIAALVVLRALVLISAEWAGNRLAEHIKLDLRRGLWRRLLGLDLLSLRQKVSGELSASVVQQVEALEGFFARYLPAMYVAVLVPLLLLAFVMPVDWIVGLLLLFSAPMIPIFMALIGWRAQAASEQSQQAGLRLSGFFADRLRGIFTLALLGRRDDELVRVHQASTDLKASTMRVLRIAFLSSAVLELFAALGVAGAAVYIGLGYLGYLGDFFTGLSLQQGLFCLLLAPEVYQPLRQLAVHYHDRADAKAALEQLERLWGPLPITVPDAPAAPVASQVSERASLSLRQACLYLPGSELELVNVEQLHVESGMSYALMGESGSGKSSLLETLVGLRPLPQGQRYFSGQTLQDELLSLAKGVVLQTQRPFMAAGTVADILRIANPQADEAALWQALEHSQAAQFVRALPQGLQTHLGRGAFGLSGGQIQRLALARVFLSQANIILLDEPTAHVDAHTRDLIMQALLTWGAHRCIVIATHDMQVARQCQQVWQIEQQQLKQVFGV